MSEQLATPINEPSHLDELVEVTRQKILYLLNIYPAVSGSMIQTGIGTSTSPKLWRPILEDLLNEGVIVETKVTATSPHERHQVHSAYHLASFDYQGYRTQSQNQTITPSALDTEPSSQLTPEQAAAE